MGVTKHPLFVEGDLGAIPPDRALIRRLQTSFGERELGSWTFDNVYFYVYEQAVAIEPDGHDLATLIWRHDYTAPLVGHLATK